MIDRYPASKEPDIIELIGTSRGWLDIPGCNDSDNVRIEIENSRELLIQELGIGSVSEDSSNSEKDAALKKIFTHLTSMSIYDESILDEKASSRGEASLWAIRNLDIKRSLVDHRAVCSSDAASLAFMADRLGIECYDVTIGRDDYSGAHQINIYRFSEGEPYEMCDVTQSRTYGMPIFDMPVGAYMDMISRDGVKPRVIFDAKRLKEVYYPSSVQELVPRSLPKIATDGLFYSKSNIDRMIVAARNINNSRGAEMYRVVLHGDRISTGGENLIRVTLEGIWTESGDASDFWRSMESM